MTRLNSKDAILDAVEQIVADRGAAHLTLDAVAEKCGISKGGLIYNFPTKTALIQATLARVLNRFDDLRANARAQLAGTDASELLVEIMATLAPPPRGVRVHAGLLAVIANEPSLLQFMREAIRGRYREFTSGTASPDDAGLLFFAAFGLHFHDTLNLSLVPPGRRRRLADRLLQLAAGGKRLPAARNKTNPKHRKSPRKEGQKE